MSLATTIIGFCFVLKNTDFLFFALCKNLSSNFSPCNSWLSNLNRITGYKKNFFKSYFITCSYIQFLNSNNFAFLNAVLLSTCFYDCVHVCTSFILYSPYTAAS